jgi:hypothetical protein
MMYENGSVMDGTNNSTYNNKSPASTTNFFQMTTTKMNPGYGLSNFVHPTPIPCWPPAPLISNNPYPISSPTLPKFPYQIPMAPPVPPFLPSIPSPNNTIRPVSSSQPSSSLTFASKLRQNKSSKFKIPTLSSNTFSPPFLPMNSSSWSPFPSTSIHPMYMSREKI